MLATFDMSSLCNQYSPALCLLLTKAVLIMFIFLSGNHTLKLSNLTFQTKINLYFGVGNLFNL